MVQEHDMQQQQQMAKYGGGGGGNAAAGTGVARASRKNKPKKIPQRGLGVAQLEKLRIEEQKKMAGSGAPVPVPSSSHALNGSSLCHLPPSPLPLSALSRAAADGAMHCGFPPVLWNPVDHTKHPYKRSMSSQPPLSLVSTGLSLTTASSTHPAMEPPSNQIYSSYGSRSSAAAAPPVEEREMAGVDRSWPFMFEGMSTAASAFRTTSNKTPPPPPPLAPFAVRTTNQSRLANVSPDMSRFELRATNYLSAYANSSAWTSDMASCKQSSSTCTRENAAFLTLSSQPANLVRKAHVVTPIHIPEFSDFSSAMLSKGSVSGSSSSSSPPPPKPFYSFLPIGPVRCERAPGEYKTDLSERGVDVELKLWKA